MSWGPDSPSLWLRRPLGYWEAQLVCFCVITIGFIIKMIFIIQYHREYHDHDDHDDHDDDDDQMDWPPATPGPRRCTCASLTHIVTNQQVSLSFDYQDYHLYSP